MPPAGFETKVSAGERPQTHWDRQTTYTIIKYDVTEGNTVANRSDEMKINYFTKCGWWMELEMEDIGTDLENVIIFHSPLSFFLLP